MVRRKPTSDEFRRLELSQRKIAYNLDIFKSTVYNIIKTFKNKNSLAPAKRRGKKSQITPNDRRILSRIVMANRKKTPNVIYNLWLQSIKKNVGYRSFSILMKSLGFSIYKVSTSETSSS